MLAPWTSCILVGVTLSATIAATPSRHAVHLRLRRSDPPADTTLTTPPTALRFWFSERPDIGVFSARLADTAGQAVAVDKARWGSTEPDAPIVVDIKGSVPPATYAVSWKAMSRDGHAVTGRFQFTVAR
jgi:methionine-rich copper-binding protein CopC